MSAVTVTAASVRPLEKAVVRRYTAGETITPGQAVYMKSDGKMWLATGAAVASAKGRGIALSDGYGSVSFAAGARIDVVIYGPVEGFASMTPGADGFVSDTAGTVDTAAGTKAYQLGWSESATIFFVQPMQAAALS